MRNRSMLRGTQAIVIIASILVVIGVSLRDHDAGQSLGRVGPIPNRVLTGPDGDVPCPTDEAGASVCATPLPTLTADERRTGVPLTIAAMRVDLDHLGEYRIFLGNATLARGQIQRMSFAVDNADIERFHARVFFLELEDPETRVILPSNIYEKGTVPGPQTVSVYLRFYLESYAPGAHVDVSGIDVR